MVHALKLKVLRLSNGLSDASGQTLVEYSLIIAFVATMVIAIGVVVGGAGGLLDHIQSELQGALG